MTKKAKEMRLIIVFSPLSVFHKLKEFFILGDRDIVKLVLGYVDIGHILLTSE
jgi:hypothetical protein